MKHLSSILAILTVILIGLACSGDETEKANALVAEANKSVTAANDSVNKVAPKYSEFLTKVEAMKNDADLSATRDFGKELFPLYDAMKENFQKAGDKFDEASKLKINEKNKEYLDLKAKEMKIRSNYSAELKKIPQALIDSHSPTEYKQAKDDANDKIGKMLAEAKDLGDKANKIQTDNPGVIAPPKS